MVEEKGATRGATSAGGAKGKVHVKEPGPIHYNYTPIMHVQNVSYCMAFSGKAFR